MRSGLPGWVTETRRSVKREVEPYREMSDDEKAEIIRSLFRASVRLMEARDDAYDVLEHRDRLPESSLRLLAHLRALRRERRKHDDHHE